MAIANRWRSRSSASIAESRSLSKFSSQCIRSSLNRSSRFNHSNLFSRRHSNSKFRL